ncbi:hypothetical protein IAI53_03010 [Thauera sp. CAU 1555]|uniref:Transposase n=1 Tax=Thauera sedimentorum TaxID=2767595 RepID=A0ABR9B7G9_9RHOO|nr:hypothetical protein [Thauera sedimentorum]MBC9070925.1 hypothetical protein [Thauera sedimentorum]MBD8501844.1 hypothetical protein [Thauera sedimentorum]
MQHMGGAKPSTISKALETISLAPNAAMTERGYRLHSMARKPPLDPLQRQTTAKRRISA